MQVEIQNFRCWKKHTVEFNEKGIILINGISGSGKSSILNSIYFAITGNGSKIVSYGEKKCMVKLTFKHGKIKEITRTKNPCRLILKLNTENTDENTEVDTIENNNQYLEDDEAEEYIKSVYGNNFQQTSYMTQKMVNSFLNLTPIEKMNFLQKIVNEGSNDLSDDNSNNKIQEMKKKCKEKITEYKKSLIEHQTKLSMYQNEFEIIENKLVSALNYYDDSSLTNKFPLNNKVKFSQIEYLSNFFEDVLKKHPTFNLKNNLDSISEESDFSKDYLKTLLNNQTTILQKYNKYNNYVIQKKEYDNQRETILKNIKQYQLKISELQNKIMNVDYKGDDYYNLLTKYKSYYSSQVKYNNSLTIIENEKNNLDIFIKEQISFLQTEKQKRNEKIEINNDNLNSVCNIDYIINNIDKWKKSSQTVIEYYNFLKDNNIEQIYKKLEKNLNDNSLNINSKNISSIGHSSLCENITLFKQNLETHFEELKQSLSNKQNELNKLKQDWNLKNQLHKCPKCNVSLRFQTIKTNPNEPSSNVIQKLKIDTNEQIEPSIYKQQSENLENDIKQLQNNIEIKQKKIFELETLKTQLFEYNTKLDNLTKRLNRADCILLKYLDFKGHSTDIFENSSSLNNHIRDNIQNVQTKMNNLDIWLNNNSKYKSDMNELNIKIQELSNLNLNFDIIELSSTENILKIINNVKLVNSNIGTVTNVGTNVIKKIKIILNNLNEIFTIISGNNENLNASSLNITKPTLTEYETNDTFLKQTKYRMDLLHFQEQLKETEIKLMSLNEDENNINNKLNIITEFIVENKDIGEKYNNIQNEINKYHILQEDYNTRVNMHNLYKEWKRLINEKKIQQYLYDTVSNDIVVHEMFLNKINETESVSLTNCIDNINYYINDYLEKFFPNDSMIVDIVPFTEKAKNSDKHEIKPKIDIRVCYKGEEIELNSLSGGEYDRVSLAIMLSFNHICKSDLILLDESIASLDADLTNDILEKLKENLNNKRIIVVAHQLNTGIFDQIVNTI